MANATGAAERPPRTYLPDTDSTDLCRRHVVSCIHGRARFCVRCVNRSRLLSRLSEAATRACSPLEKHIPPSDFGLTPEELRAEANKLVGAGWSVDEVVAVLAVTRRAS